MEEMPKAREDRDSICGLETDAMFKILQYLVWPTVAFFELSRSGADSLPTQDE